MPVRDPDADTWLHVALYYIHTARRYDMATPLGPYPRTTWSLLWVLATLTLRGSNGVSPVPQLSGPEGPSTQYFRFLVPKPIPLMSVGTRVPKYWVPWGVQRAVGL